MDRIERLPFCCRDTTMPVPRQGTSVSVAICTDNTQQVRAARQHVQATQRLYVEDHILTLLLLSVSKILTSHDIFVLNDKTNNFNTVINHKNIHHYCISHFDYRNHCAKLLFGYNSLESSTVGSGKLK